MRFLNVYSAGKRADDAVVLSTLLFVGQTKAYAEDSDLNNVKVHKNNHVLWLLLQFYENGFASSLKHVAIYTQIYFALC